MNIKTDRRDLLASFEKFKMRLKVIDESEYAPTLKAKLFKMAGENHIFECTEPETKQDIPEELFQSPK